MQRFRTSQLVLIPLLFTSGCTSATLTNVEQPMHLGWASTFDFDAAGPPISTSIAAWDASKSKISFGLDVCLDGVPSVTITKVYPIDRLGHLTELPPLLMSSNQAFQSIFYWDSYPPDHSEYVTFEPLEGSEFTFQCQLSETEGDLFERTQAIVIGLDAAESQGGGWTGISIEYESQGESYTFSVPIGMYVCGELTEPCPASGQ